VEIPGSCLYTCFNRAEKDHVNPSKELAMKKIASIMLIAMLGISLAACATHKGAAGSKVKCPACGYEFMVPEEGGG